MLPSIAMMALCLFASPVRSLPFVLNVSKIANFVRNSVLSDGVQDSCCPLKLGRTSMLQSLPAFRGFHRFLPALTLINGGTIYQMQVQHFPRYAGTAKYHLMNRLISPFIDMLGVAWLKRRQLG